VKLGDNDAFVSPALIMSTRLTGSLQVLASAVAFGSMAILARYAYADGASAGTLLFLRFFLAGALLLPWLIWQRQPWPRGRTLVALLLMGGIGYTASSLCYFNALRFASAGTVALLFYLYPAVVLLLSTLWLKEKLTRQRLTALILALAGLAITVGQDLSTQPLGLVLGLATALIYSLYILAGSRFATNAPALSGAAVVILAAAASNGALVAVEGFHGPASWHGWAAILGMALLCTVVALALFLAGLGKVGAARAAVLSTLEPVVTLALAWPLLGEALSASQLAGGALILLAVLLISREADPQRTVLTDLHD